VFNEILFSGSTLEWVGGWQDGASSAALFNMPTSVALDSSDNTLYVTSYAQGGVRAVTGETVTTLAGLPGAFGGPAEGKLASLALDEDLLYAHDLVQGLPALARALHGAAQAAGAAPAALVATLPQAGFPPGWGADAGAGAALWLAPAEGGGGGGHRLDAALCDAALARPAAERAGAAGGAAAAADEPVVDWMSRGTHMHLDLYDAVYKHADAAHVDGVRRSAAAGARPRGGGAAAAAAAAAAAPTAGSATLSGSG